MDINCLVLIALCYNYYSHFIGRETEAWRLCQTTHSKAHCWEMEKAGFEARHAGS